MGTLEIFLSSHGPCSASSGGTYPPRETFWKSWADTASCSGAEPGGGWGPESGCRQGSAGEEVSALESIEQGLAGHRGGAGTEQEGTQGALLMIPVPSEPVNMVMTMGNKADGILAGTDGKYSSRAASFR